MRAGTTVTGVITRVKRFEWDEVEHARSTFEFGAVDGRECSARCTVKESAKVGTQAAVRYLSEDTRRSAVLVS